MAFTVRSRSPLKMLATGCFLVLMRPIRNPNNDSRPNIQTFLTGPQRCNCSLMCSRTWNMIVQWRGDIHSPRHCVRSSTWLQTPPPPPPAPHILRPSLRPHAHKPSNHAPTAQDTRRLVWNSDVPRVLGTPTSRMGTRAGQGTRAGLGTRAGHECRARGQVRRQGARAGQVRPGQGTANNKTGGARKQAERGSRGSEAGSNNVRGSSKSRQCAREQAERGSQQSEGARITREQGERARRKRGRRGCWLSDATETFRPSGLLHYRTFRPSAGSNALRRYEPQPMRVSLSPGAS
jgi:hypothetical protein